MLRFACGACVSLVLTNAAPPGRGHFLELHGTRGSLVCERGRLSLALGRNLASGPELRAAGPDPLAHIHRNRRNGDHEPSAKPYGDDSLAAYRQLARELVTAIRGGEHHTPSFEDGYRSLAFAEASRDSARTGRWVRLAEPSWRD
jgi:predicted dehydrogenase